MDKSAYKQKHHKGVYLSSENRELYRSMNGYHFPKWILDEMMWFYFRDILEHADFHAKGNRIIIH